MKERVTLTIEEGILKEVDRRVDGMRIKNRSHAVELLLSQSLGNQKPSCAIILAGGKGTRLEPITKEIPKPLIPVHDRPLLEHCFDLFKKYGIKKIILALGYKADKIKEAIGNGRKYGIEVEYTIEKEPLGTAGPVKLAKDMINSTFIVSNADELKDIDLLDMYLAHKENKALITIALTSVEDPSAYGVAKLQGQKILEFVEKPKKEDAPSNLINAGLYIMEPEVIEMIPDGFSMLEKDIFPKLAKQGKLYGYPFAGQWYDTGTMERYEKALREWKDLE